MISRSSGGAGGYQDNSDSLARTDHLVDDKAEPSALTSSPPPSPQLPSIGPAIEGNNGPNTGRACPSEEG